MFEPQNYRHCICFKRFSLKFSIHPPTELLRQYTNDYIFFPISKKSFNKPYLK